MVHSKGASEVVHAFIWLWMQFGTLLGSSNCKGDDVFTSIQKSKGPTVKSKRGHRHGKGPAPQVGEYVQWTSNGVDQFRPARKVTQIQDRYVWVDGSQTGIPISEVTVVESPAPIPVATLTTPAKSGPSDKEGDGNELASW